MTLTQAQEKLLNSARQLAEVSNHGLLVSGHGYRTAEALERKGLGELRYQGPSRGWFKAVPEGTYDRMEVIVALEGGL